MKLSRKDLIASAEVKVIVEEFINHVIPFQINGDATVSCGRRNRSDLTRRLQQQQRKEAAQFLTGKKFRLAAHGGLQDSLKRILQT